MILSDYAVRKRVTVYVLTAVIVVAGIISYRGLPLEAAPDVNWPHVFVQTFYRGVSPEDMEKSVTIEIEKWLKGLDGVKKIKSVSSEGVSQIDIEFTTDIDINDALTKVKDKVDLARADLPTDLDDDPMIFEVNFSEMPILVLSLSGTSGMRSLTRIAEDLEDEIEAIRGVLDVDVVGGITRQILIEADPERLVLYGLSFSSLEGLVGSENANVSGGSIRNGRGRYQLRVPGEFRTAEELMAMVVGRRGGDPVYLRDVARVIDGMEDRESYSRTNGRDAVTLYIKKRIGENIVDIVRQVDEVVARKRPSWPRGTRMIKVQDRAKEIRLMVEDLENNIISGLILVVVVVMVGMGLRNALLVSLSIPLSMLLSFLILSAMGITLNMVVLFSLTLALGMLVDNAIVITENIYRFMQQGVGRVEAAMRATGEVAWPIIGSTMTTIGAFLPLLFWDGIMGGFMVFLPKTVIITLGSCLFVAMVINPALAAAFMKVEHRGEPVSAEAVMQGGEHPMLTGGGRILATYRRVLRVALRFRLAVVAGAGMVMVAMFMLWLLLVGLKTPKEFFPKTDPKNAWITIKPPQGVDLDYIDNLVREVACRIFDRNAGTAAEEPGRGARRGYSRCLHPRVVKKYYSGGTYEAYSYLPGIEYVYEKSTIGRDTTGFSMTGGGNNQVGVQFVDLEDRVDPEHPEKRFPSARVVEMIEKRVKGIAGAEITVGQQKVGPPTGAPVNIEISGDDFMVLGRLGEKVKALVESIPYVRNVRSDFEPGAPNLEVRVDRRLAGSLGLNSNSVGSVIRSAINGTEVSTFHEHDNDYDIVVRFNDADRHDINTLSRIFLPTLISYPTDTGFFVPVRGMVPLSTVARVQYTGGLGQITRIDNRRVVTVSADVDETMTTGITVRRAAEKLMRNFSLPPGYACKFTGEMEFQKESEDFLSWAMMVALIIILMLLVWQFNSVTRPLIIMSAVVLSFAGVFLGLALCHMPFGIIMTGVGVVSLAGVVVNNAIVLVDYIDQLVQRGMGVTDAIVAAGATRLRPVMLTAISTILALIPMVTGVSYDFHRMKVQWVSESSQFWSSMAAAVIFGLGLATMLTLVVVPVLYSLAVGVGPWLTAFVRGAWRKVARLWWLVFDKRYGTGYAEMMNDE